MEKNNTTERAQPQPAQPQNGTPATGAVDGEIATTMDVGRPIPLVTKDPISPVEEEIDEPSLKRANEPSSDGHSASKRVRKEPSSDGHPPTKEVPREQSIAVKEAEIRKLAEKIEGCKKP